MPSIPEYAMEQLRAEKQAGARLPAGHGAPERRGAEPLPEGAAASGLPAGAEPLDFLRPALRAAPFVLLLVLASACSRRPDPARPPATPPATAGELGSVFLAEAIGLCRETCAPRDPAWTASEVAGATHVRCSCPPLSTLQPGPRVKRIRPKVSSTSAEARGVEGPAGAPSQPVHEELGAVAVEDSGRTGLSFTGGTP